MDKNNLILDNYGVILKRLTHDKIELVRSWRNDPKIQQTMFFQDYITPEMQEKWFNRIDNNENFYFIIEYNNEEIGLINIKNIDYGNKNGETGVFIYEDKYLGTDIAYKSHLVMFDFIFNELALDFTYAHIKGDNPNAIRFSIYLGATLSISDIENNSFEYIITKSNYLENKNRHRFIKKWNILMNK